MSDSCVFCQIIREEQPAYIVYEDQYTVTFLDRRPLFPGHCLLVPREHFETLPEVPDEILTPLFKNARLLAEVVKDALGAQGSFVAMNNTVSQSVPHLHVHIVPRTKGDGLKGFFWPRQPYEGEDHMRDVCDLLSKAIAERF